MPCLALPCLALPCNKCYSILYIILDPGNFIPNPRKMPNPRKKIPTHGKTMPNPWKNAQPTGKCPTYGKTFPPAGGNVLTLPDFFAFLGIFSWFGHFFGWEFVLRGGRATSSRAEAVACAH